MRLLLPFVLLLPLLVHPARADTKYDACVGAEDATEQDMGECGGAWVDREDARLNVAWKKLTAAIAEDSKEALLDEQRAWLAYRDKSCLFYLDNVEYGQNGRYLSYPACRAAIIEQRTQALKDVLEAIAPQ